MEELLIVTTGGTIDKVYFDDKSDYQVGEPQIGRILQELGVAFRFNVIPILRKDSLHIDAADRELLRATIAARNSSRSAASMCRLSLRRIGITLNRNATPSSLRIRPICGSPTW